MSLHDIPALNAGLNALATVLMTLGFVFIRQALRQPAGAERTAALARHRAAMLSAGAVSALFLVGYVAHKILVRACIRPSEARGRSRPCITRC